MSADVYLATLELDDGSAWASLHTDGTDAHLRVEDKAEAWGVRLGDAESPNVRSYSVSRLPIEGGGTAELGAELLIGHMTRSREVREYAERRDIDLNDAIVELVNTALSHPENLITGRLL